MRLIKTILDKIRKMNCPICGRFMKRTTHPCRYIRDAQVTAFRCVSDGYGVAELV